MANFGEQKYLDLIKKVLEEGEIRNTRNSVTKSLFSEKLDFAWATDNIKEMSNKPITHFAGAPGEGSFRKVDYTNPFTEDLSNISIKEVIKLGILKFNSSNFSIISLIFSLFSLSNASIKSL